MKKIWKTAVSFLAAGLLVSGLCGTVHAEKMEGGFGGSDTVFWELDTDTKTLTISGNGRMPRESTEGYPFKQYNAIGEDDLIRHVVIGDGINWVDTAMTMLMADCTVDLGKDVEFVRLHGTVVSVSVHPDNPYYEIYDDCLYTEDRTELLFQPRGKKSTDLPPELRTGTARLGGDAFTFSEGNEYLMIYDDCIYSADGTELLKCPDNKSEFSFHPALKHIGGGAFGELPDTDVLVIPWGVISVDSSALSGVGGIRGLKIVLPDTITEVRKEWKGDRLVIYRENTVVHSGNSPVLNSELEYQLLVSIEDLSPYYGETDPDTPADETVIVSPPATECGRTALWDLWSVPIVFLSAALLICRLRN